MGRRRPALPEKCLWYPRLPTIGTRYAREKNMRHRAHGKMHKSVDVLQRR